jgi:hypothetical protein
MLMMLIYWAEAYIVWRKNAENLVIASKVIGLEVNAEKTKYMVMSWNQNAGHNHNIKIDNKILWKGGRIQIFGSNPNESKLHSWRN